MDESPGTEPSETLAKVSEPKGNAGWIGGAGLPAMHAARPAVPAATDYRLLGTQQAVTPSTTAGILLPAVAVA